MLSAPQALLPVANVEQPPPQRSGKTFNRVWLGWILPLMVLLLNELAVRKGWVNRHVLPSPSDVFFTLIELASQGLGGHVLSSTARVIAGFSLGAGLGLIAGASVGLSRNLEALLNPSFQALRAIPSLAWVPLLLLWLGIDEASKVVLIAIGAFFPVYMGVSSGFRDIDRKLMEIGHMYGLGPLALVRRIMFPAALPPVFTGLRNGLSMSWMFMVAAELIAATKGLGYLLTDGRETSRADIVLTAIVLLAIVGKLSDSVMHYLEQRLLKWRDTHAAVS